MTQDDLGPKSGDIKDPKKNIKSGFVWLGFASMATQILDSVTIVIVMMFISKADMGLGTLAVSFAAIIESFKSFGVEPAFVQDKNATVNEAYSLFWFTVLFGLGASLLLSIGVIPVSRFYNNDVLIPLMLAGVVKLFFMSVLAVPMGLINRRLEFQKISALNTFTVFMCDVAKIVLAMMDYGAWCLVIPNVFNGIFTCVGSFILSKFVPRFHFDIHECKRYIKFGYKHCLATLGESLNKYFHYFIVGKFFGESTLGLYRVGYEVAMTPALALMNVVNRSSFPVFAKIKEDRAELTSVFSWNQSNIGIFCAVPIVAIFFCAEDIFMLINDGEWLWALSFMPLALVVAFLKALMQTFPELYRACGHSGYALKAALAELVLIAVFFMTSLGTCQALGVSEELSLKVMFCAWIVLFLPLFCVHRVLSRPFIDIGFRSTFKSIRPSLIFTGVMSLLSVVPYLYRHQLPWEPWLHIVIEALIMLACIAVYVKWLKRPHTSTKS